MAVNSCMIPLGTIAPSFCLPDSRTGKLVSLETLKSDIATVVMFLCNHCPYVKHIEQELIATAALYQKKGVQFVAISSNDVANYPQDGPNEMKLIADKNNYSFPYLYDESQVVAKEYQATCTPDFFVYDKNLRCVYRGRFDDSTPGNNRPITGQELKNALNHLLTNSPIDPNQYPSMGCSIKWKKGA